MNDSSHKSRRRSWRASTDHWKKIKPLVREMRKNPTRAEQTLWKHLRRKNVLGVKFRRQMPIDRYIVDFCSPSIGLIIEVDGPTHEGMKRYDAERQLILEEAGFEVLRFSNEDVLGNIKGVLLTIYEVVDKKIPN